MGRVVGFYFLFLVIAWQLSIKRMKGKVLFHYKSIHIKYYTNTKSIKKLVFWFECCYTLHT